MMITIRKEQSIEFEKDKTLYHYTSMQTAIEYIFQSGQLRLSPVMNATDPMERMTPNPHISVSGYAPERRCLEESVNGVKMARDINDYYKSLKQLCLCRNSPSEIEGYYPGVFEPIDHFGFAKPRMWDQYADNYKGVCIALSRPKVEQSLKSDFYIENIEYIKSRRFRNNYDNLSVDLNRADQMGVEKYMDERFRQERKKLTEKHCDYTDENECKIITSTKNQYAFIDIRKSIQGIFVTNQLAYAYEKWLLNIAEEWEIPAFQIHISRNGLDVRPLIKM